jgi:hypothetical protein
VCRLHSGARPNDDDDDTPLALDTDWSRVRFRSADVLTEWPPAQVSASPIANRCSDPEPIDVNAWMLSHAESQAIPPKRDAALAECRAETGCTYRAARSAWKKLPSHLKRKPRQTDRALTGQ